MNLSELMPHDGLQQSRYANDPAYAAECDRLAFADAVSVVVVNYRAETGLTQSAFADRLGWKQPHVARLERGDITPSLQSLERLAKAGILEVHIGLEGARVTQLPFN